MVTRGSASALRALPKPLSFIDKTLMGLRPLTIEGTVVQLDKDTLQTKIALKQEPIRPQTPRPIPFREVVRVERTINRSKGVQFFSFSSSKTSIYRQKYVKISVYLLIDLYNKDAISFTLAD